MTTPMDAAAILDREFLELRAKILQLAASFDRLDRGMGLVADDPRMQLIHDGLKILQQADGDRAEQLQLLFSRAYADSWRTDFQM